MVFRNCLLLLLLSISILLKAQNRDIRFGKQWQEIDSLIIHEGLSKTALEKVNGLYTIVKPAGIHDQVIRCLLYRISLEERIMPDDPNRVIKIIQAELSTSADTAEKAILYSLLAKQYLQYFRLNQYKLFSRTNTSQSTKNEIDFLSSTQLTDTITHYFLLSLRNPVSLQKISTTQYSDIIISFGGKENKSTLYDLLMHEALDYFTHSDKYTTRPVNAFSIADKNALAKSDIFIASRFETKDSSCLQWKALELFQQWLSVHKNDETKAVFIQIDLERIEWVYAMGVFKGKSVPYQNTLENIKDSFGSESTASRAWYLLARLYMDKAKTYQPFGDTTQRYSNRTALKFIKEASTIFPENNPGMIDMRTLLAAINAKQLSMQSEKVNLPVKPFRVLVTYRNIDTLYGRIIRVDKNDSLNRHLHSLMNPLSETDKWAELSSLPVYRAITQALPPNIDNQLHSAEIKIDGLPVGEYALLSSSSGSFNDQTDKLSVQLFSVSGISYIKNNDDYFVVNRVDGKPMKDVKVTIFQENNYYSRGETVLNFVKVLTTDKNGFFNFSPHTGGSFRFLFETKNDKLFLQENEFTMGSNSPLYIDPESFEKNNEQIFYFTDRSIYRLGQTVYFKGIAVTRDYHTKLSKLISRNDSGWVYLKNVQNQVLDSLPYMLNNFGSFNGKFHLPENQLTGRFSISASLSKLGEASFSVEEYKRPGFVVKFDKPIGAYKLNDSVEVIGRALAYTGNPVSNAKLSFQISRNIHYSYRRSPINFPISVRNREISHGELTTDAEGRFHIHFIANADDIIDPTGNSLFDFDIHADITDINGETRSGSTTVTTGFKSLQLTITAPEIIETDSLQKILVSARNLSNDKEATKVQLKISPLHAPNRLIRKRYWERPDQFILSEKDFVNTFPTDEYDNESNIQTWPVDSSILITTVNTGESEVFTLQEGMLKPGFYKLEASCKDKYGEEITQELSIQLFSQKNGKLPIQQCQFNYTLNNQAEPKQLARFISATSINNIFVISKTDRPQTTVSDYDYRYQEAGMHPIEFSPSETDRGGVYINEAYVYDNRLYTHQYFISVPWTNKTLTIQAGSYRNLTEPGSPEAWNVTVQGDKGEKVAAELLTSMYDASLDQFKTQNWQSPNLWVNHNSVSFFDGYNNFSLGRSLNNYGVYITDQKTDQHDHLATFGSEIWKKSIAKWVNDSTVILNISMDRSNELLNEVVIVGYGDSRKKDLVSENSLNYNKIATYRGNEYDPANIQLRGNNSNQSVGTPLYIIDGKISNDFNGINGDDILSIEILDNAKAVALYGTKAANGAIIITTKKDQPLQVRKNFIETAFFFPALYADSTGKFTFSFSMPDAVTQWKWMSFAHTKDLAMGYQSETILTRKKLMVQANAPRFLREGDNMEFSGKISNLTDQEITGQVTLELFDGEDKRVSVDGWFQNVFPSQYFTVETGKSFPVKFPIQIPFSFNRPITWRLVAKAGSVSDGEENTVPVLTNRVLVTESVPMFSPHDTTIQFIFPGLLHANSETLTHESITVEYTSNPIWNAVKALPYLMESTNESSEAIFNRFYAYSLAAYIVNKQPLLKTVFERWKKDSSSLQSNLEKNNELKQLLLEETPWVLQAISESAQRKNIGLLFDQSRLRNQTNEWVKRLSQMQLFNGAFPWFPGGNADRYVTNYILTGIGKLIRINAITPAVANQLKPIVTKAIQYLDEKLTEDYELILKQKKDTTLEQISSEQISYLYMRSFFGDIPVNSSKAYHYFYQQGKQYWVKQNNYLRAELGMVFWRNRDQKIVSDKIVPAILENAVNDPKMGMYWKSAYTVYWYSSPIEHQSMMIDLLAEIIQPETKNILTQQINAIRNWLLLNKQTNNWKTSLATADACYALLLNGSDWLQTNQKVSIRLGNYSINSSDEITEAGTGYLKKRINGSQVSTEMGNIQLTTTTAGKPANTTTSSPSWGAVYWQYLEDMDKLKTTSSPLSITKKLFIEKNTDKGKLLDPLKENEEVKPGDKLIIRMEIHSDRELDYVHLKDTRASSMEPVNVLSGYKWSSAFGYYESTKDASTDFFISHLSKGSYVFEYPVFITHTGIFSVGLATIQCMYAPEFVGHSEGGKIRVANE